MHHLYPLAKGDPLCPLGFHPQVRWPTRCKRCFRDYKEHGGKKRDSDSNLHKDASTVSTPSLSWNSGQIENKSRSWMSSSNLSSKDVTNHNSHNDNDYNPPSSWISTPDLANMQDDTQPVTTVNIKLPKRKLKPVEANQRTVSDSVSVVKTKTVFNENDSLATRAKKLHSIKEMPSSSARGKRIQIKEVKTIADEPSNNDVKSKPRNDVSQDTSDDDTVSITGTETTDTTLVNSLDNELRDQLESLKQELDVTKTKCERLEREKSDILLRRLATMESASSKTSASEVLKLQQKCNELQQQLEDYKDEKKSLSLKVKELEEDLETKQANQESQKLSDDLRSKLLAAETLCEELMDENEDLKRDLRDMEEQMDELQDNFREDQVNEYTTLKKDLDQTTKNCRILSFKLRKAERTTHRLEIEKAELEKKMKDISGSGTTLNQIEKIKQLEQELKVANEVSLRLQKELEEAKEKISQVEDSKGQSKKKPLLGTIGKSPSADGKKVSRESLTRGGSQDDPAQLLRDLQDSLEREADLREQLKFTEEEAANLRKKVSRIEDENEYLVLQVKKMATRARTRKLSPTNQRLTPEPQEKSEASDDEDPAEIKLQLELSEQEASVLRHKIEDLEADNDKLKARIKELQESNATRTTARKTLFNTDKGKDSSLLNEKIKVLEDETNDIRKKLIEKERDCERLHAELSVAQKRSKGMQKSKSLDLDQHTLDLRRQLQVIDQEASVLRNKVQSLEVENEKLSSENNKLNLLKNTKSVKTLKTDKNAEKYVEKIAALELEIEEKNAKLKELEENRSTDKNVKSLESMGDYKKFSQRTPKRVSVLTSRDNLKTMVEELEKEIAEMLLVIKTNENAKIKLEEDMSSKIQKLTKDFDKINKKYENIKKEVEEERNKLAAEIKAKEEINKTLTKTKESLDKLTNEKTCLKEQIEKLNNEKTKLSDEKKTLDEEIVKLKSNLKSSSVKQLEITQLTQKVNSLKTTLDSKEKEYKKLKDEQTKMIEDNSAKSRKIADLELQLTKFENKCNESDKKLREQTKTLESEIEKCKDKIKSYEKDMDKLKSEKGKLNEELENLQNKIKGLDSTIQEKDKLIKQFEESLAKEKENVSKTNVKIGELEKKEIAKLKDTLNKNQIHITEIETKLENSNKIQKDLEGKLSKSQLENKNSKIENEKKLKQVEMDLQNERKKIEVFKTNSEKEQKNKELELNSLKDKIKKLEKGLIEKPELKQLQSNIEKLETMLGKEKQKYEDLTAKYEILEEEHVVTKAKFVMEKETLESQYGNLKKETEKVEKAFQTLKESYKASQDSWTKEKLQLQEKLKLTNKLASNGNESDRQRLKALLEEKQSEYDQIKRECETIHDQMDYMRKENDDLRKKLDDYDKVDKIQRNMSADSSAMEKEIRQLRIKLTNLEKSKKADLAELKIRYESQMNIVNGELKSLQNQVVRFKREKDTYKHMLESAQKTIGDLKQSPKPIKDGAISMTYDEMEESKQKIASLEQQISCMEDELSEARLECSKLRTELVSERSSWEVKLSELHSKINELEEEKVLSSGRTKIVGLKTKMELAWQKEREEQQRLLQETATLARDLRQTLFEVERERDKERLEAKRKQDQYKKTAEEEQEENKRKITELQYDLLELRDAYAKLRTTNEKLRREKEFHDKEREEHRLMVNGKKRSDQNDERKINDLIEQFDTLKQLAPELFFSKENEAPYTPTPPRRTKSKSRETSPAVDKRDAFPTQEEKQIQIQYVMQRLVQTTENLRRIQRVSEDDFERERIRRAMGTRRATSSEHDSIPDARYRVVRKSSISSLKRKSLSLEHTTRAEQKIWNNNDSTTSLNSLELHSDNEIDRSRRDASLDSRLSSGSAQSELGDRKKKKGIMGKLKKLTKSRSIDDQDPGTFSPTKMLSHKSNSQADSSEDTRGSKKDLKERISGIFRRSGSSSRSNSVERRHETSSTQRPLARTDSNGNVTPSSFDFDSLRSHSRKS